MYIYTHLLLTCAHAGAGAGDAFVVLRINEEAADPISQLLQDRRPRCGRVSLRSELHTHTHTYTHTHIYIYIYMDAPVYIYIYMDAPVLIEDAPPDVTLHICNGSRAILRSVGASLGADIARRPACLRGARWRVRQRRYLPLSHPHIHTHSLSHTHTHSLSHSHIHTHTHTHAHTLSHSLTHTHI